MTGAGLQALVLPRPLPTPLLAFAIRELGCVAGVMVTASHNPPQDNGYKVYLGDGSQIVPPADAEIAARIAAVGRAGRRPARRRPARSWTRSIVDRYLDTRRRPARATGRATCASSTRRCTASAARRCCRCWRRAGFAAPYVVEQQEHPGPGLPDRGVPEPRGAGRDGPRDGPGRATPAPTWWWPTTPTPTAAPRPSRARTAGGCCAATRSARCSPTTCSPRQAGHLRHLDRLLVAARQDGGRHGQPYVETLTGFKWIGRVDGPGLRLRGGARLLRGPRARPRQGRRLGAAAAVPSWPPRRRPRAAP